MIRFENRGIAARLSLLILLFLKLSLSTACTSHHVRSSQDLTSQLQPTSLDPTSLESSTPPKPGSEAIFKSLNAFRISLPPHVLLTYDPTLTERGRTRWQVLEKDIRVTVGPSAFASWGLLGSTLGHELEVHCQQNLTLIGMMASLGAPSIAAAETDAYRYELAQAPRFGLSSAEQDLVRRGLASIRP